MKQILLKILKILLIFMLIALVVLLVFGMVLILDWPPWVGFFILLGLIGLVIAFILLRKIWLKRRERLFVQTIIEQDEAYVKGLAQQKERDNLQQLQVRWKETVDALKRSHLRKYGNPLYVLPWYLVIGESGSGKTTAIKSARLSSPFTEVSQISGVSGTRNCDWWFFEQAIIIDTAGRYTIPVDESKDKEEWRTFINLLANYRKREPLNGLIVTIAANKLLEASPETLKEDGSTVRRRINELIRVLGTKPPIYVLVTKCDLIQGMTRFCDQLPDKTLDQAMGFINQDLSTDVAGFLERSLNMLIDRLRDFRLLLLHRSGSAVPDPGLLLFPEEMKNIKQGLASFITEAFQENPYQETQLLRGLFFTSGRQEGSPYSHFLKALGLIEEKEVLAGTSKGLFLHDLFAKIIPKDRHLFAPTQIAIQWKRLTKSLALTSWVAIGMALCGLLSFSFVKNMRMLREFSHQFSSPPELHGEILTDMATLDRFREAILKMENRNQNWWIPRFGLHESKKVEHRVKDEYFKQFQKGFLTPLDDRMAKEMAQFSKSTPHQVIGQYITHIVRRINLLKTSLEDKNLDALLKRPRPTYEPLLLFEDKGILSEINDRFGTLYLYCLIWHSDPDKIKEEIKVLQPWLKHILTLDGTNLQWLVAWANGQPSLSPVTLEDFWEGSLPLQRRSLVATAFTAQGKKEIDSFLLEMESALPDPGPPIIAKQKLDFADWYRKAFFDSWYDFGDSFQRGIEKLKGKEEWQQTAARMSTDQGPFFSLLDRMASEMEALSGEGSIIPSWVELIYRFQDIKAQAAEEKDLREGGLPSKTTQKVKRFVRRSTGQVDPRRLELDIKAAKAYTSYRNALTEIAPASASKNAAYQNVYQVYSEDPATSKLPFYNAHKSIIEIKNSIGTTGKEQKMPWAILTGPLDYLWALMLKETACYLQDTWNETVMAKIQGVSGSIAVHSLLGQDGHALKFVEGPAKPFIGWDQRRGYYAKVALGGSIAFNSDLLSFLSRGASVQYAAARSYSVSIEGKPTNANHSARIQPYLTILELNCNEGTQRLENYNFPCSETFVWAPDRCEDITLEIRIKDINLTKNYKGYNAFPNFLNDFKGGKRTFFRNEFPEHERVLTQLGISYINVEYRFTGSEPVLKLLNVPTQVPRTIARCWE